MEPKTRVKAAALVVLLVLGAVLALVWWGMRPTRAVVEAEPPKAFDVEDSGVRSPAQAVGSVPTESRSSAAGDGGRAPAAGEEPVVTGFAAAWGAGLGQLGRSRPEEGNPEAPMSFAVGRGGVALVLDQVNGRMVRYGADGTVLDALPTTQQVPQDLVQARDGTTLVLDRLGDKTVAVLKDGKLVGDLPLEGKSVGEAGGVTGVFVDGEDVYVEREHGPLVRVGDTSGRPDSEQPEVPGRPSRDGQSFVMAGIVDALAGRLFVNSVARPSLERRFTRELRVGQPALSIILLDTDLSGVIYLAAVLDPRLGGGPGVPSVKLLCLAAADGAPLGSADLPANTGPEETLRDLVVLDAGGVIYAQRTEQGVTYTPYDCR